MRALFLSLIWLCSISFVICQSSKEFYYDPDAIVDAKTAQEKWRLTEYRLKSFMDEAVGILLPKLMNGKNLLNVSSTCLQNGLKVIAGVRKLKSWAIKFLDASTKSIDGILGGTIASFGDYDECINNKVIDERKGKVLFQGMYCSVEIRVYLPPKPPTLHFTDRLEAFKNFTNKDTAVGDMADMAHLLYTQSLVSGLCVPSGCSQHDVNQLLRLAGDFMGVLIKATRCEIKEETEFTPLIICVITLYSFTGFLVLISTLADMYFSYRKIKVEGGTSGLFCSFSLITNFRTFTSSSTSPNPISCLNGIRTLTMGWIVLSHSYLFLSLHVESLPHSMEEFFQDFAVQAIINGTFSVDTFFFIGGLLVCYNTTKLVKIGKKTFSFTMYVSHRLWRLLPCYVYVIAFTFLIPVLGSGPIYHKLTQHFVQPCYRNWWANILFINNFYETREMCASQGWYLAVDMQFYLGALLILLPLMRSAKVGISIAVSLILASMIGCAVQVQLNGLPAAPIITPNIADQEKYMTRLLTKPHYHAGPYIIGMLCGYLLAMNPKVRIPKIVQIMGWSLAATFSLCVVNGVQRWNSGAVPSFWEKILYSSCSRVAWGMAVAWVVVACSTGHGGVVNHILSSKMWIPLGRLSFLVYLVNPLVMVVFVASARTITPLEHIIIVWQFFGHLIATYLIAFGGTMLVEAPFLSLEKVVFATERHKMSSEDSEKQRIASEGPSVENGKMNFSNGKDMKAEKCQITNTGFVCRL